MPAVYAASTVVFCFSSWSWDPLEGKGDNMLNLRPAGREHKVPSLLGES